MKHRATVRITFLIVSCFCLGVPRPGTASEPLRFSGNHTFKLDESHAFPVGDNPDHLLGVFKSSGTNKSTGQTTFLNDATETEIVYYDVLKGSGRHHGFIYYKSADGTLTNEFDGFGTVVVVDGKPQSLGVGSWHTISGTGRYANGVGAGTYTSRLALPNFEGATEWEGTFVENAGSADSSSK